MDGSTYNSLYILGSNETDFGNNVIFNVTNINTEAKQRAVPVVLEKLADTTVMVSLVMIMFGMGCATEIDQLVKNLRRPIGPGIGMLCQFVVLPLSMFGVAHVFRLEAHYAIGLIAISATPGGALSNVFSYWVDGDVSLR